MRLKKRTNFRSRAARSSAVGSRRRCSPPAVVTVVVVVVTVVTVVTDGAVRLVVVEGAVPTGTTCDPNRRKSRPTQVSQLSPHSVVLP